MRVQIYLLLLVVATGLAIWRGVDGERRTAATVLVGNVLTASIEHFLAQSFFSVSLLYLALDAALAVVLCVIAVRHPCWVTMLVASFQIDGTLGHVVKLAAPHTIAFSYAFLLKVWAWPMVASILLGRVLPGFRATLSAKGWPRSLFPLRGG